MCYAQEGGTGAEESDKVLYELGEARRWGGGGEEEVPWNPLSQLMMGNR